MAAIVVELVMGLGLSGLAAQAGVPVAPAPAPPEMNIFHLFWGSGWVVRFVLFILIGFSVGCWGIALAKGREMRRAEKQSAKFIDIFWEAKNLATIQTASLDLKDSPVAQAFRSGDQELHRLTKAKRGTTESFDDDGEFGGVENVQRAMQRARIQEGTRLARGLTS